MTNKPRQRSGSCTLPGARRKSPDGGVALQQGGRSEPWLTCRHTSVHHGGFAVTPKQGAGGCLSPACPGGGVGSSATAPQPPRLRPALPPVLRDSLAQVTSVSQPVPTYSSETPNRCQGSFFGATMHVCLFSQTYVHDGNSSQKNPSAAVMSYVNLI